jgi:predicted nucleic acid-binding Zn ribbon protein
MLKHGLGKRDGKLGKLGFAVNEYLAEGGQLERSKSSLCAEIWPQVVGHWYGRHSRVVSLDRKELKVCCDTPALAQQLQFDQETVIARLNERLGGDYIKSIRPASVGQNRQRQGLDFVEPHEPLPEDAELLAVTVPEAALQALRRQAGAVPEGLREAWLRTGLRLVRLQHWRTARGFRACAVCGVLHNDLAARCFACRIAGRDDPMKG